MSLVIFSIPHRCALSNIARKGSQLIFRLNKQRLCTEVRYSKLKQKIKKLDFEKTSAVKDDVLLFSYDQGKTNMFYAGGSLFIAFSCLNGAHLIYTTMKNLSPPVQSDGKQPWYMWWEKFYVGHDFVPKVLALILILTGAAVVWITNATISHHIKSITILRGGEKVVLEHFSFLGRVVEVELPLEEVSAVSPKNPKDYYLIKMKGQRMNYILDDKGVFHDLKLFNSTVGVQRF